MPEISAARAAASSKNKDKSSNTAANGDAAGAAADRKEETALSKAVRDSTKVSVECQHGLLSQILKDTVFKYVLVIIDLSIVLMILQPKQVDSSAVRVGKMSLRPLCFIG